MAGFEVWQVVKVPFPYINRPIEQFRPALVIAIHTAAGSPSLLWVLMITSAENRAWQGDVEIGDLAVAGLPVRSVVRCAKIATIETLTAQVLGTLTGQSRRRVKDTIAKVLFGGPNPL